MITVVIKPNGWHRWVSPSEIRRVHEHAKDLSPDCFQPRPAPTEKDGEITNQAALDKWDQGWRQWQYDSEAEIPLEVLSYYLPCEVKAIHFGASVAQIQQRTDTPLNTRVQVITPGHALQDYDEVFVETNCCTDHLQGCLNDGWRILAICVQPDQRRPDYILGRRLKEGASLPVPHPDRTRHMPNVPLPTPPPNDDDF